MSDDPHSASTAGTEGQAAAATVQRRGFMLVLSSPSGAGKTTISRAILKDDPNLTMSVSVTTRPCRPDETPGVDYDFVDQAQFDQMRRIDGFLEWAKVFDYYYATPVAPVDAALERGQDVLFDIDWQGTQQLAQAKRSELASIFILPPSMETLRQRLLDRGQDSLAVVTSRMNKASDEISHWPEYDYVIVNDDLSRSLATVKAIIAAERSRRHRQNGLVDFVSQLRRSS